MAFIYLLLKLKQKSDRKMKYYYQKNSRNKVILKKLQVYLDGYNPTLWMPSTYIKLLFSDRSKIPFMDIYIRREHTLMDGGVIGIDRHPLNFSSLDAQTPIIVLVPGYLGDSRAIYIANFCEEVFKKLGWRICIYNRRGYSNMPFKGDRLISFDGYSDLRTVLEDLREENSEAPFYLMGISIGGMFVQRYLQEYSENPMVRACYTISSAWNIKACSVKVTNNPVFKRQMSLSFLNFYRTHFHEENFQRISKDLNLDWGKIRINHQISFTKIWTSSKLKRNL